jgi:hypothetical protein
VEVPAAVPARRRVPPSARDAVGPPAARRDRALSPTRSAVRPNQGFNLTAVNQQMDQAGLSDIKLDGVLLEQTRKSIPD